MADETTNPNNPVTAEPAQPETAPSVAPPAPKATEGQGEAVAGTQTVSAENNPTPQVLPPAPEPSAPATADTASVEMPPDAPEAPTAEPVSESPNIPVNTEVTVETEPEKTPENIVISEPQPQTAQTAPEQTISPSVESSVETAQTAPNEPLNPEPEKAEAPTKGLALKLLIKAREAIQFRRRKKLDKLMSLFLKKPQITNDDVEKLLHVSDATATRYLSILEKEGKIKQSGKTGKGVSYSRI